MVENGVAFPTGAKPHFGRAIHTGSLLPPPPSPPFGKDIIPLGRGLGRWSVATGMESDQGEEGGGGEEMRKEGENAKRSWPGRSPRFTNYSISPAN